MCQKMDPKPRFFRRAAGSAANAVRGLGLFQQSDGRPGKAPKTSSSHSSAYTGTVACALRGKSKCLRGNRFACFGIWFPSKHICVNAGIRFPAVSS